MSKNKEEPKTLKLSSDDNCFARARNICTIAGIGLRPEIIAFLAEGIQLYMDLDKKANSQF